MSIILSSIIVITAFLAIYWVFYGQRKYNEMLNPKRKTELKAIVFDLDGVIIDSFEAWFHIFNRIRRNYNLKEIGKEDFKKKVWGGSVENDAKLYFNNEKIEIIAKMYRKMIMEYIHKLKLEPDVKKVLDAIKKKKIKIGLATNTFRKPTLEALKFHKINEYFDSVVTSDDVEKAKPYPDSVIKACENLKVEPDETIYVGDTKNDYKAGKSAGCFVVGLNTHGDLIISQLRDLLQLI